MAEHVEKVKILIVDDLREKLLVYDTILKELDETLVLAQSGEEALKHILRDDFAVVLMDVNMPGMDGLETAALIRRRARSAHLPIIFITAFVDEIRSQAGYAQGAVDYILAPVEPVILRTKVKVFVDLFRMRQEAERRAEERISLAEETARRIVAEKSNRSASFLSQVSRSLSQSLDCREIITRLTRFCVPFLAPCALASVVKSEADVIIESAAEADAFPVQLLDALRHQTESLTRQALVSNVKMTLPCSTLPELAQALPDSSLLALPLVARGTVRGCLVLLDHLPSRKWTESDLSIMEEVCFRAATALDTSFLLNSIREADQRKDVFLAMLAHELRNPLAPIRNAVEILKSEKNGDARLEQAKHLILKQTEHLTHLVDDLLDVSRITRGKINLKLQDHPLSSIIEHVLETSQPVIAAHGHLLDLSLCDQPIIVHGDATRLSQILSNLLSNATKYTPQGGQISLSTQFHEDHAVIQIKDSGIGIPPEQQNKIFELFAQVNHSLERSQGGLGIGLTLVKQLIELHGGTVAVSSAGKDLGSEFTIRLPARLQSQSDQCQKKEARIIPDIRKKRILVVDDNHDAADSMAILLEMLGNDVLTAHDGVTAIECAEKEHPEIILLDIGLPRMNGYDVAQRIRSETWGKSMFIIAVTGWGQDQDRQRALDSGCDDHLTKPVEPAILQQKLSMRTPANLPVECFVSDGD